MFSTWMLVAVSGVGTAALGAGLWWALADFLLDHLGRPGAEWTGGSRDDGNVLSGDAAA